MKSSEKDCVATPRSWSRPEPSLARPLSRFFLWWARFGAQCRNFLAVRMPVRTCKQVVFLCDAVHVCLVFLQRWCPSTCHLMMTLLAMCARWEACCLVHGVVVLMCTRVADMDCSEAAPDEGSCVLCTLDQDENNSLILLCCRNRIHVGCFAQSVQHFGTRCPFCSQDVRQHVVAMERDGTFSAHGLSVNVSAPPLNSNSNSLCHSANIPTEPNVRVLCCNRLSGPPDFSPLENRRMEWSPVHPEVGHDEWIMQWICRSCGRNITLSDVPSFQPGQCVACSTPLGLVVDAHSGHAPVVALHAHGQPFLVQSNQWGMCQVGFHQGRFQDAAHYMVGVLAHSQCLGLAPSHGCFAR